MNPSLRIKEIERITLRVPFKPRNQKWNKLLVWQWQIVEIIRVTTDDGTVGYGETLPHYTWGKVPEEAMAMVAAKEAAIKDGSFTVEVNDEEPKSG